MKEEKSKDVPTIGAEKEVSEVHWIVAIIATIIA